MSKRSISIRSIGSNRKTIKSMILNTSIVCSSIGIDQRRYSWLNWHAFQVCSARSTTFTGNQLEACRKVMARIVKRQKKKRYGKSKYVTACSLSVTVTRKSKNARMGRGKGGTYCKIYRAPELGELFLLHNVDSACALGVGVKIQKKLKYDVTVVRHYLCDNILVDETVSAVTRAEGGLLTFVRRI